MQITAVEARPSSACAEIEAEIHAVLETRTRAARRYGPPFERFWSTAVDRLRGGKLMRPRLLIEVFDALALDRATASPSAARSDAAGGSDRAVALRLAAALELLHFAFLLHDDVIDGDLVRRGSLNFIGQVHEDAGFGETSASSEDAHRAASGDDEARRMHWARSSGILAGDLMLAIAHQVFARTDVDDAVRRRLLDLLDETVAETVAGEHADVGLADGAIAPDFDTVLAMTRMKTASYTFELPLRVAAILADADDLLEQRLARIGRRLGLAYQLQDDLLSAFGRSASHGKDDESDLREGKQTPLIGYARTTSAWPEIRALLGETAPSLASRRRVRHLLVACGAKSSVEKLIGEETRAALDELARADGIVPTKVADCIRGLAAALHGRTA